ncbi:neuronal acetylcholine receptor subunit alpha-9-like [Macrobrachium nipponense]|uniref:neuronal acetylcholine receptor subunit alpha-9-like n=1 Tax=Macrobrachium nipponense TaxID=159736 RepID=UPI0030C85204
MKQIQLVPGPADLSKYNSNPEFFLENFKVELREVHNPCCKNMIPTLTYTVQLQRRTVFSLFFFIMPGILINICALMVFWLPADSGEKVGLGINALLAMIVFLMAMTENLPPTEKLPLAGVYYGSCISLIAANITATVFVLSVNGMGLKGYHVPEWIQLLTLFVAKIIFIQIPFMIEETWELDDKNPPPANIDEMPETPVEVFTLDQDGFNPPNYDPPPNKEKNSKKEAKGSRIKVQPFQRQEEEEEKFNYNTLKDPFQRRALKALESLYKMMRDDDKVSAKKHLRSRLVDEWQFIARVLDKAFFVVFTTVCFLFNIFILTSSPFRERFDYCPLEGEGACDEMTFEEIKQLTVEMAANYHITLPGGGGAAGGGGH